ncbi:hypothetical protein ASPWEDRAFT_158213 [Aspergillus wentii DTO 134E9]|uniref:AMP-dependent synthetase/ligase domain-containing protein n=1 Tax=Aspergillus wentii DTO 134E9 TaxID=1073089 RepID=A0A1L9RHU2_ASPWE|nr:uncharacterized protein ASPWEDRAFT_158213 [Aspergillus wentii DTO 134E9]KAI9925758.1 hypothetical protein MW887_005564 [Aspergillus wentii]OJJ34427.1 hypothetical protein ASPWEDRAFT_158213 [Aspergillus wentii DTO 134E9]
MSLIHGPTSSPLSNKTISTLIAEQTTHHGDKPAIIVPWQSIRLTYRQLSERSAVIAKAMLEVGLRKGDCVGIMAGNCHEYIEVFLGGARIGCPVVVLNSFYTGEEVKRAVMLTSCKLVFIAKRIGQRDLSSHAEMLRGLPELDRVVCLEGTLDQVQSYNAFTSNRHSVFMKDAILHRAEKMVTPSDILNLQFTSGTTGSPKAAMLTHNNLINNASSVGNALHLSPSDIICSPPPLFHCFGLVMGFLASFTHGSSIIFPSDFFNPAAVVDALIAENATVLLGVPTMYIAEMEVMQKTGQKPTSLRTGLASGSAVSMTLMNTLRGRMGVEKMLIAYGMTETSPVTFITSMDDSDEKRSSTIGKVMPHCAAKIVDKKGDIVDRGVRGEICTSGYVLQKGYWRNEEKTREVMKVDDEGVVWMYTGDEGYIDEEGYGHVTGRIKDIIIRGGENIWPTEIEERLISHPLISEASVVGLKDERYGEAVGCFLKAASKLSDKEVQDWVSQTLGRHKAPKHIFWIGDARVGDDFPKTGSGKHQKHVMRAMGDRLIAIKARL